MFTEQEKAILLNALVKEHEGYYRAKREYPIEHSVITRQEIDSLKEKIKSA